MIRNTVAGSIFAAYVVVGFLTAAWITADPDLTKYCPQFDADHGYCNRVYSGMAGAAAGSLWPVYWTTHAFILYRAKVN